MPRRAAAGFLDHNWPPTKIDRRATADTMKSAQGSSLHLLRGANGTNAPDVSNYSTAPYRP